TFKSVTFKLAGNNSRLFSKPAFNLKIHDEDLYGRSQFKLRADGSEPTFLRTKLVSDIHNRLGVPSISTNYIKLFINDYYMGLYLLSDTYKPSWVKQYYGEKNTPNLYQCEYLFDFKPAYASSCFNENKDVKENGELKSFLEKVKNAKSASDIESIFEVDHFLTEMAIDYLLGSWDHIQNPTTGHNFYLYKQKNNGKWIYLSYDFDLDFGMPSEKLINMPFEKYIKKNINLVDLLILQNPTRFEKILKDIVAKVFNPGTLYPHIDELKKFIKPLVQYDKTPDAKGNYPGRLNTLAKDYYSMEVWDANSEFTRVKTQYAYTYGLKYWVLYRYRFVCNYYKMNCDSVYMNENYRYTVNRNVEYRDPVSPNTITRTSNTNNNMARTSNTNNRSSTAVSRNSATRKVIQCWSELTNHECCPSTVTTVTYRDEYGDWGFDYNKKRWCGLTRYKEPTPDKVCWSKPLGYDCCKSCKVYLKDENGSWGIEFNRWCGIQSYCKK
ncbi:Non-catalytic module family DOC2, partial [Piromyces sp. E2]